MKPRGVLKIMLVLAGTLILAQCRPPTPIAAAGDCAPEMGTNADQPAIKERVTACNEAESAGTLKESIPGTVKRKML